MNNKPWYEKVGIWIGIIAGICTILGVSILGGKSLIKDRKKDLQTTVEVTKDEHDISNNEQSTSDPSFDKDFQDEETTEDNSENQNINEEKIPIYEVHSPNDYINNVYTEDWNTNSDIGIDGKMYGGGIKVTLSNFFTSTGSNSENKITSRITLPLSKEFKESDEEKIYEGTFVLTQSMYGSKSSGIIKIIVNNTEVFSTGEIDGNTTTPFPFSVSCEGADSIIIQTDVTLRGSDFEYGMVVSKQ